MNAASLKVDTQLADKRESHVSKQNGQLISLNKNLIYLLDVCKEHSYKKSGKYLSGCCFMYEEYLSLVSSAIPSN